MITVRILPTIEAVGAAAADLVDTVAEGSGHPAVLGFATGSSPDCAYREVLRRHSGRANPYRDARVFLLDEYIGLPPDHPERYSAVIRRAITDPLGIPADRVHAPDPDGPDLDSAGRSYDRAIADAGGVDLQLLGVGRNGHIAFNEPGTALTSSTHVVRLTEQTRRDNARFFGGDPGLVPERAMTQGIGTILSARRLLLIATGSAKAEAIASFLGTAPTAALPVSALHLHRDATVLLDPHAAARVDPDAVLPSVRLDRSAVRDVSRTC